MLPAKHCPGLSWFFLFQHVMSFERQCTTAGERICIEVDGPHHFSTNTLRPSGENLARQRLLRARGWAVVSIPFCKWSDKDDDDHVKLLQQVSADF